MQRKHIAVFCSALLMGAAASAQPPAASGRLDFGSTVQRTVSPARAAAQQALNQFALRLRDQEGTLPAGFPFDVRDVAELRTAQLGYGFEVFDADAASLARGESLEQSARPTGTWRFAVVANGRMVGLITLAPAARGWEPVSFGGAGISREIDAVVYAQDGLSDARLRYVRVPQATADFIEVKTTTAEARFAPLQAARESLRLSAGHDDGLLSEREVQAPLRRAIEQTSAE